MSRTQDIEHSDILEIGRIIRVMCVSDKLIYGKLQGVTKLLMLRSSKSRFLLKKSNQNRDICAPHQTICPL